MQNIPTELLRAFIPVIDLKGFTRAGERLGRSQPAISLQIKRLQDQLGCALFDRENGGSNVTEYGRIVEAYARRMLAINDELVAKIESKDTRGRFRIGVPMEFADTTLQRLLSQQWARTAGLSFDVICDIAPNLLSGLRDGAFDFAFAVSDQVLDLKATAHWDEPIAWVGRLDALDGRDEPLRILSFSNDCPYRALMKETLAEAGRPFEIIYTSPCISGIRAALNNGFGITALPVRAIDDPSIILGPQSGLPALPSLKSGIFVSAEAGTPDIGPLAMHFAEILTLEYKNVA